MVVVTLPPVPKDTRTLVRSGDLKKKVKWKRAEGVEGPSPGPVFGGNGRTLMGRKGPYLLLGEILIPGFNRPVQSQAVNWATQWHCRASGGPPAVLAGVPGGPKAAAAAGHIEAASRAQHSPLSAVDYVFIMDASERARSLGHWHREGLFQSPAFSHSTHDVCRSSCAV